MGKLPRTRFLFPFILEAEPLLKTICDAMYYYSPFSVLLKIPLSMNRIKFYDHSYLEV